MNHQEFVEAYRSGTANFYMAPEVAANEINRRLWLPLIKLPVIGIGVAMVLLALQYHSNLLMVAGVLVFVFGVVAPIMIKKNAIPTLLYMVLHDEHVYEDLRQSGVLEVFEGEK